MKSKFIWVLIFTSTNKNGLDKYLPSNIKKRFFRTKKHAKEFTELFDIKDYEINKYILDDIFCEHYELLNKINI